MPSGSRSVRSFFRVATLGLALAAGLMCLPAPAGASSVVHLAPEQVLAQADVIFQGRVVSSASGWTDDRHLFATTEYTLEVERVVLDRDGWLAARTTPAGTTVLSFMGGVQGGIKYNVSGMPTLAIGESAFFFMSGEDLRNNSMSPVIGVGEGLYRVAPLNGEWKVFTPGGCAGPMRPVDFRYFTKFRDPQVSYTPEEFATEITRALPRVAESPDLRATGVNPVIPPELADRVFGPGRIHHQEIGPSAAAAPGPSTIPSGPMSASVTVPPVAELRFTDPPDLEYVQSPAGLEWGVFANPPTYPIVFNVPPGQFWTDDFQGQEANWNRYATAVFRFYTDSNNSIGWPNGRFETAFLNSTQLNNLYGRGWGANTLGICFSRNGLFGQIVEADIAYNVAFSFTDDPTVTYSNPSIYSIRQVILHEQGHSFGRQHSWDSNPGFVYPSTMNYFSDGFYQTEAGRVFADDSESIRIAYPGQAVNQTDFGITLWGMSASLNSSGQNGVRDLAMPASVLQGNFFSVSNVWLENIGTNTRATNVNWYLDPNPHDNNLADAYYCQTTNLGTLDRANGVFVSTFVQAPAGIPPGTYFLSAIIDGDSWGDNSIAWSQNTIRVDYNPAFGPPSNDPKTSPRSIGIGTTTGSTQFATNDGTAGCGSSNTSADVWFTFVAPYAGSFEADTCGSSFDTVLSVSQRQLSPIFGGGFTYVELNCSDDAVGGDCSGSLQSRIFANNVSAGAVLRIRLAGFNGARGNYTLRTRIYPLNDFCSNAAPVTAGTFTATLAGATNDQLGTCGSSQSTPDVWFRYTWPSGCNTVNLNTIGSNFDTVLEVWPVCSAFITTPIGCNDDCGAVGPSCLTVHRGAESTLRIRVTNYGGTPRTGDFIVLNVSTPAPSNDTCEAAVPLVDGDYPFDSSCGNTDSLPMPAGCESSACVADFWFTYTAPITGQLQVTSAADFPMAIALYPGYACPGDPEQAIACNIGLSGAGLSAAVAAGDTFLIRMGGSVQPGYTSTPIGAGAFSIHTIELPPANDACEAAQPVSSGQSISGNLTLATADGSSSVDRVPGGADVWYAFTAPADGLLTVGTCTTLLSSGLDTVVSIHSACPGDATTELTASDTLGVTGCPDSDPMMVDPEDAQAELSVTAGSTYLIRIGATDPGVVGSGAFTATIRFTLPGDSCASAATVADGDNPITMVAATPDGPIDGCFDVAQPDVWYAYTASCTGTLSVGVCGVEFDSVRLAIYDGAAGCPVGDPLACGSSTGSDCATGASAQLAAVTGQSFLIRVGGFVDSANTLSISCTPTPPACPQDFNQDGDVNPDDLGDFITCYFTDPPCDRADFNADGDVNPDDLGDFITGYFGPAC